MMEKPSPFAETKPKKTFRQRLPGYTIILLVLIVGTMYGWKTISDNAWENQLQTQKETLTHRADSTLQIETAKLLRAQARPLAWLIERDLQDQNLEAVRLHLNQLVQEKGILEISLVDQLTGRVAVDTDKKFEGKQFSQEFPLQAIAKDGILVDMPQPGRYRVGMPVSNGSNRIGTLVMLVEQDLPSW